MHDLNSTYTVRAWLLKQSRGNQAMRGVLNIVLGLVFIVGGMSGKLVLRGTHSGEALAVFGIVLIALGVFRLNRR